MNKKLSDRMKQDLQLIGAEWARPHYHTALPTLEALVRRGLIEARGSYYGHTMEVRRVQEHKP